MDIKMQSKIAAVEGIMMNNGFRIGSEGSKRRGIDTYSHSGTFFACVQSSEASFLES